MKRLPGARYKAPKVSYFRVYSGDRAKGRTRKSKIADINAGIKLRKLSREDILSIVPVVVSKGAFYEVWYVT